MWESLGRLKRRAMMEKDGGSKRRWRARDTRWRMDCGYDGEMRYKEGPMEGDLREDSGVGWK